MTRPLDEIAADIYVQALTVDRLCAEIEGALSALDAFEPEFRGDMKNRLNPLLERGGHGYAGFARSAAHQISLAAGKKWTVDGAISLAAGLRAARPDLFKEIGQ